MQKGHPHRLRASRPTHRHRARRDDPAVRDAAVDAVRVSLRHSYGAGRRSVSLARRAQTVGRGVARCCATLLVTPTSVGARLAGLRNASRRTRSMQWRSRRGASAEGIPAPPQGVAPVRQHDPTCRGRTPRSERCRGGCGAGVPSALVWSRPTQRASPRKTCADARTWARAMLREPARVTLTLVGARLAGLRNACRRTRSMPWRSRRGASAEGTPAPPQGVAPADRSS